MKHESELMLESASERSSEDPMAWPRLNTVCFSYQFEFALESCFLIACRQDCIKSHRDDSSMTKMDPTPTIRD